MSGTGAHDVKLDNLDMEMSDEDENDNENRKQSDSFVQGLPIPTINNIKSPSVRTHLDPRQNRMQNPPSLYSPPIKTSPVRNELEQVNRNYNSFLFLIFFCFFFNKNATKNPLGFLTSFISKSSTTSVVISNNNHINQNPIQNNNNNISKIFISDLKFLHKFVLKSFIITKLCMQFNKSNIYK